MNNWHEVAEIFAIHLDTAFTVALRGGYELAGENWGTPMALRNLEIVYPCPDEFWDAWGICQRAYAEILNPHLRSGSHGVGRGYSSKVNRHILILSHREDDPHGGWPMEKCSYIDLRKVRINGRKITYLRDGD